MLKDMRLYAEKRHDYDYINTNVSMDVKTRYFMLENEGDDSD